MSRNRHHVPQKKQQCEYSYNEKTVILDLPHTSSRLYSMLGGVCRIRPANIFGTVSYKLGDTRYLTLYNTNYIAP